MLWTTFNRIKDIIETYSDIKVKFTKHKRYKNNDWDENDFEANFYLIDDFKPKYSIVIKAPSEKVIYHSINFLNDFYSIPNFNKLKTSDILELVLLGKCKTVNFDNINDEDKPLSFFEWINTNSFIWNEPYNRNLETYFKTTDAYRILKSIGVPSSLEELNIKLDLLGV